MAQTGFTPIQLYSSSTPANAPAAGDLVNDTKGSELAVNIADGKLFYKDISNNVQTLANKTWIGTVTNVSALTIGTSGTDLSSTVANPTSAPVITLNVPTASAANRGALSSTDWSTFNSKQAALVSGTNIKTVNGTTLLGSGDLGTFTTAYGGTGLTSFTQGDLIYYDSGSTLTALAKNTTATRYLANTGTNNNPAWAQIDLSNGVTGVLASGNLPVGSILQVVSATTSTPVSSTSTSFADTGLTATITPTKATSKILVIVNQNNLYKTGASLYNGVKVKLLRGSTDISNFAVNAGYTGVADDNIVSAGVNYIDSPATTSATTYKTQFAANIAGQTVEVQNGFAMSTITLLEIAA